MKDCDHANAEMARGCISTGYKLQPEKIALHQSLPPETVRWRHIGFEGVGGLIAREGGTAGCCFVVGRRLYERKDASAFALFPR